MKNTILMLRLARVMVKMAIWGHTARNPFARDLCRAVYRLNVSIYNETRPWWMPKAPMMFTESIKA